MSFSDKGGGASSDAEIRTFWQKNFGFFEMFSVSARTMGEEGLNQCGYFADKGRGRQFFAILCGRLLWTAP